MCLTQDLPYFTYRKGDSRSMITCNIRKTIKLFVIVYLIQTWNKFDSMVFKWPHHNHLDCTVELCIKNPFIKSWWSKLRYQMAMSRSDFSTMHSSWRKSLKKPHKTWRKNHVVKTSLLFYRNVEILRPFLWNLNQWLPQKKRTSRRRTICA